MISDADLRSLADRLVEVPGVVAVMLGGSRARGDEHPDSDVDLGLYYRPPLDTEALRRLAQAVASTRSVGGHVPDLTEPGGWGPWVDGGGWLTIDDTPVDWIYRDLDRVRRSADQALAGEFAFHFQVGHPFGIPDFAYAGEVALGIVLADPTGSCRDSRTGSATTPPPWAERSSDGSTRPGSCSGSPPSPRGVRTATFVAGCLFRVVTLCAYALHARAGRWVVNEKGLVDAAARLDPASVDFGLQAHGILGRLGTDPTGLLETIGRAEQLVDDVSRACASEPSA